jgi:polyferredoxin
MLFTLGQRTRLDLSVRHERNPQFVQLADGSIRNSYIVNVRNMETRPRDVELRLEGLADAGMWRTGGNSADAARAIRLTIAPDSVQKVTLFVDAPGVGPASSDFAIAAHALTGNERGDIDETRFLRPETGS